MKTIEEILENYEDYETFLDDRFGVRLAQFLSADQIEKIGFEFANDEARSAHIAIPFTREAVLEQLKKDVEFGWMKACDERGISANLMFEVVRSWCKVLEDGLENWGELNYGPYGKPLFMAVANKYGWPLEGDCEE